jgi:hypothetical protein
MAKTKKQSELSDDVVEGMMKSFDEELERHNDMSEYAVQHGLQSPGDPNEPLEPPELNEDGSLVSQDEPEEDDEDEDDNDED